MCGYRIGNQSFLRLGPGRHKTVCSNPSESQSIGEFEFGQSLGIVRRLKRKRKECDASGMRSQACIYCPATGRLRSPGFGSVCPRPLDRVCLALMPSLFAKHFAPEPESAGTSALSEAAIRSRSSADAISFGATFSSSQRSFKSVFKRSASGPRPLGSRSRLGTRGWSSASSRRRFQWRRAGHLPSFPRSRAACLASCVPVMSLA